MEETDNDKLLKEILTLVKNSIQSDELLTRRVEKTEENQLLAKQVVDALDYLIRGNGEPGMNERLRLVESAIKTGCDDLKAFKKEVNIDQLRADRFTVNIIKWVSITILTIILGIMAVGLWKAIVFFAFVV